MNKPNTFRMPPAKRILWLAGGLALGDFALIAWAGDFPLPVYAPLGVGAVVSLFLAVWGRALVR